MAEQEKQGKELTEEQKKLLETSASDKKLFAMIEKISKILKSVKIIAKPFIFILRLLKKMKETPRFKWLVVSSSAFVFFVSLTLIVFFVKSISNTNKAVKDGQIALVTLKTDEIVVGNLIKPKEVEETEEEKVAKFDQNIKEAMKLPDEKAKAADAKSAKDQKVAKKDSKRKLYLTETDKAKSKIAIIVTDLGLSKASTLNALEMSNRFTLGLSPYANNVDEWIDQANSKGFEVLINLPMQPMDYPVNDPGPYALLHNLSTGENLSRLDWVLARSDKPVGVYSSENETFTSSRNDIMPVLEVLKKKKMVFVSGDRNNAQTLQGLSNSIELEFAPSNIIIDSKLDKERITRNLLMLEGTAKHEGYAIGIMHSYPITIEAVKKWMKGINREDIVIVPISNVFHDMLKRSKKVAKAEAKKVAAETAKKAEQSLKSEIKDEGHSKSSDEANN